MLKALSEPFFFEKNTKAFPAPSGTTGSTSGEGVPERSKDLQSLTGISAGRGAGNSGELVCEKHPGDRSFQNKQGTSREAPCLGFTSLGLLNP